MFRIIVLFFVCLPVFSATFNDLSLSAQEYLEKKSKKEDNEKWYKRYNSSYEQALSDNQVMNEQIFFSNCILNWAIEKRKKIAKLEDIDKETLIECCRYFSLMISKNLDLPSQIKDGLKQDYLDIFVTFLRKKKDEA